MTASAKLFFRKVFMNLATILFINYDTSFWQQKEVYTHNTCEKCFYFNLLFFNICVIPKLFHKADLVSPMKLTQTKLTEMLRRLADGKKGC